MGLVWFGPEIVDLVMPDPRDRLAPSRPPALKRVGYWHSRAEPHWPDPRDFVDLALTDDERLDIVPYLERGWVARAYMGKSTCRIFGMDAGSLELTDGTWIWPDGLAHYVGEHSVKLPADFTEHAASTTEHFETVPVDDSWWKNIRDS